MESINKISQEDIMNNEMDTIFAKEKVLEYKIETKAPFTIRIYKQSGALSYLHQEWKELAEKSNQHMCMSPDWARSWWKHLGQNKKRSLYIITAHYNGKMVAIFPFFKGITTLFGKVIDQRLQLIGSGGNRNEQFGFSDSYGISDFLDFIVDPDFEEPIADLFISMLNNSDLSNHRIIFHQIRDDSFIKKQIYPLLLKNKWSVEMEKSDVCPYIDIAQTDNLISFVEQCKSNARRRFRQIFRAEEGPEKEYRFEEATTYCQIEEMTNNLIRLHQKRWNSIGFPGAFYDKRFKYFFKELVFNAHKNNQLWLKQAIDSGGVCAVRMLLLYNGRYYDYMSGYDDDSPSVKHRPGIALLLNLINDTFDKNISTIELLRGEEGYKYDFTDNEITNWKITIPARQHNRAGRGILFSILFTCSKLYQSSQREAILMKIQYRKKAFFNTLPGYIKFRISCYKD